MHHETSIERASEPMSVTERLCAQFAAWDAGDLPPETIAAAQPLVADGIAVALAGSGETGPRLLAEHLREMGGAPMASVLGMGFRTSLVQATALNGTSMHVLDYEPMWSPANHAVSTTLPAVLALAEARQASGRELLMALVKGCELQGLIRAASGQYLPRHIRFHPPGVVGVMGAAVAAGHLLALDGEGLQRALGIAASRAGSLITNVGTMTKATHCGHAAAMGLEAALLAARGFTANPAILDGDGAYSEVFFGLAFPEEVLLGSRPPYRVVEPGYAIKLFPSQYATHFGITAGLAMHGRARRTERVRRVRLVTPVMPYVDRPTPRDGLDGKFSLQYTAVSALLDGQVTVETFSDARRFRPAIERLLACTTLEQSEEIGATFETMHVELTVELDDGTTLTERCDKPPGAWDGPRLSPEAHQDKVRACLSTVLDGDAVARCIDLTGRCFALTPAEVGELLTLLRHEG